MRVAVILVLILLVGCSRESSDFRRLRLNSKTDAVARPLAESLRRSEQGVRLALRDMNIFGGKTRGWSSWIVRTTELDGFVEERLRMILVRERTPLEKRIEANWLMWVRTSDDGYLEEMFALVREPGPLAVGFGRGQLVRAFADAEIQDLINVPGSKPLPITLEEFRDILNRADPVPSLATGEPTGEPTGE